MRTLSHRPPSWGPSTRECDYCYPGHDIVYVLVYVLIPFFPSPTPVPFHPSREKSHPVQHTSVPSCTSLTYGTWSSSSAHVMTS